MEENNNTPKNRIVHPFSTKSLFLELYFNDQILSTATGFICKKGDQHYLITNWHVITGLHNETLKPLHNMGGVPNKIGIWLFAKDTLQSWICLAWDLFNEDGTPRWKEHSLGGKIDVVALPIVLDPKVDFHILDLELAKTDMLLQPSESVSIIGFPGGVTSEGKFPIWKTAHIASDLDLNYSDLPIFLVDTTSRPGMSGSPVLARKDIIRNSQGTMMGDFTKFLGIYSGRIPDGDHSADRFSIGKVWKPEVLDDILR